MFPRVERTGPRVSSLWGRKRNQGLSRGGSDRGTGGRSRAVVRWTRELRKAGKDGGQELTPFHLGVGRGGLGECGVGRGVPVEEGMTG